ncbi:MAG: hypothetical protein IPJ01_10780 [Micavibrio sp.]|jgi:hypothetical protein|nr:hypothetical protein [Micavibrio sp.]
MILNFKYGFSYDGFLYGWQNKKLYRLPSTSGNKSYGLKELSLIPVGNGEGYRIKRQKFSVQQLLDRSDVIDVKIKVIKDSIHLPV